MRNWTRDEGGLFGSAIISSHRKLFAVKSRDGERCGEARTRFRRARSREASASKPLQKCRRPIWAMSELGGRFLRDQLGGCLGRSERRPACGRREARPGCHMERESLCSVAAMARREKPQAAPTARARVPLRSPGSEQPVGAKSLQWSWSEGAALFSVSLANWKRENCWWTRQSRARPLSAQISGDAPPPFINRCGGLKIGVR
ncbi:hypothetical protein ABIB81_001350 [Bradyrhizobium sp. I1.7.5]